MTESTEEEGKVEPITVFTAEHCDPCHEIVDLLKKKSFASDVGAPINLIDIESEEGFEHIKDKKVEGVPSAQYKGKSCKLEVDEERRIVLITCGIEGAEDEEAPEVGSMPSEGEGNPT